MILIKTGDDETKFKAHNFARIAITSNSGGVFHIRILEDENIEIYVPQLDSVFDIDSITSNSGKED